MNCFVSVSEVQELQPIRHAGEHYEGSQRRLAEVLPGARYTYLLSVVHNINIIEPIY